MNENQIPSQKSCLRRILKWLVGFMLLLILLYIVGWVLIGMAFNLPHGAYFKQFWICRNTTPPEYQALPDNLISLDELIEQRERLGSAFLGSQEQSFENTIFRYATHPYNKFYLVYEQASYSRNVYACSENQRFRVRFISISFGDYIIWARQDGNLYIVKIKEYSYEGVAEISFDVYDGDTLELITRDYDADSDLD